MKGKKMNLKRNNLKRNKQNGHYHFQWGIPAMMVVALSMMTSMAFAQQTIGGAKPATKTVKAMKCANCTPETGKKTGKHDACAVPVRLTVSGMSCQGCATSLKTALSEVEGVEEVTVDFKTQKATVWVCGEKNIRNETLKTAVKNAGFQVVKMNKGQAKIKKG